jgi:hypothetical protein
MATQSFQDSNPLGAIGEFLFGGSKAQSLNTLNQGQEDLLGTLTSGGQSAVNSLYGTLGGLSTAPQSTYQSLPNFEQTFNTQFGDPLKAQYTQELSQIANSPELFSGGNLSSRMRAAQNFNTQMASARAGMMMQEREKERQSMETALQRQLSASQLLSSLGTSGLGVKAVENTVQKTPGLLSAISSIGQTAGNLAQTFSGLGGGAK